MDIYKSAKSKIQLIFLSIKDLLNQFRQYLFDFFFFLSLIEYIKNYLWIFNCFFSDDAYIWMNQRYLFLVIVLRSTHNQFRLMMIIIMNTSIYMNNRSLSFLFFSSCLSSTLDSSSEFVTDRRATLVMRGYISEEICQCKEFYPIARVFPVRTTIATTSDYLLTVVIYSLSPFCLSCVFFFSTSLCTILLLIFQYVLYFFQPSVFPVQIDSILQVCFVFQIVNQSH